MVPAPYTWQCTAAASKPRQLAIANGSAFAFVAPDTIEEEAPRFGSEKCRPGGDDSVVQWHMTHDPLLEGETSTKQGLALREFEKKIFCPCLFRVDKGPIPGTF